MAAAWTEVGAATVCDGLVLLDSNAGTVSVQPLLAGTVTVESLVLRRQSLAAHTTHALRACTLQGTLLLRRHLPVVRSLADFFNLTANYTLAAQKPMLRYLRPVMLAD